VTPQFNSGERGLVLQKYENMLTGPHAVAITTVQQPIKVKNG